MGNETQWTPGPWITPPMPRCGSDLGIMTNPANRKCQVVAMVVVDEDYPQEDAEQCANARLIAAAPEMAALLERNQNVIMDALTSGHGITPAIADDMRAVLAETRALLAKIKKGA